MNDKELREFVKRKQAEFTGDVYSPADDEFSGLSELDIEDYDGKREIADYVGDRQQFKIDRIPDDGGSQSAYKRMLQRMHDHKQRGRELQERLAIDNHSSKGDRRK